MYMNNCKVCKKPAKNKFCSRACAGKASTGGYRPGSGRAKTGYYRGIYCGSTYELAWVIFNLDNHIQFERFSGFIERDGVKYFPDFLQGNTIVEIKGYESEDSVAKKSKVAEANGYSIVVLRRKELESHFRWVNNNYKFNKMYELYDDYKPQFQYICGFCGKEFVRYRTIKTVKKYCSRICSGKSRIGLANAKGINQYNKHMLHSSTG